MITGFQLDSKSKSVPVGLRIVLTLRSPDKDTFTLAISALGVIQNYAHQPRPPKPDPKDEVWIEPTPESKRQHFIIHTPGNQRILLGDFPFQIAIEISIEREVPTGWLTTNKVLIVLDKNDIEILQAREFALDYQQPEVASATDLNSTEIIQPELDQLDSEEIQSQPNDEVPVLEPNLFGISEWVNNLEQKIQSDFEPVDRDELPVEVPESSSQLNNVTKPQTKHFRFLKFVAGIILIMIPISIFSPLSFIPLDQPEKEKSKLVVTWSTAETVVGDTVVASLINLDGVTKNYVGTVENKSGTTYLLRTGEDFIQVDLDQIRGHVIISIPFIGSLF